MQRSTANTRIQHLPAVVRAPDARRWLYHSPGTRGNRPEAAPLLVQGAASLQRYALVVTRARRHGSTEAALGAPSTRQTGAIPGSTQQLPPWNCVFDTGDDCIAVKSGRNADARRVNVPSEDILISSCEMKAGHGGVVIGSEMSGGVRNVFVEDCRMSSPDLWYMLRIKTNSLRGGFVENAHVRRVRIGTIGKAAIRINFHYAKGDVGGFVPRVSNVTVSNVVGESVRQVLSLHGYERSPVRDIRVSNCRFTGVKKANGIEFVEGLVLMNVRSDFSQ